jgi:hypothetical protein
MVDLLLICIISNLINAPVPVSLVYPIYFIYGTITGGLGFLPIPISSNIILPAPLGTDITDTDDS